ncbi:Histone-lysine N-methyltransferase member suvh2 [Asimina triloba]
MTSPVPFIDLNLLPDSPLVTPKLEPKAEPHDEEPLQILPPAAPNPNPNFLQQIPSAPEIQPPPASADADDVYSEFFRISELFRSAFADRLRRRYGDVDVLDPDSLAIIPAGQQPLSESSSAIVASTRAKRHRSKEMVRVTQLGIQDHQQFRMSVRSVRMIFESLRLFSIQEEERAMLSSGVTVKRVRGDLKASAAMMDRGMWLNRDKRIIGSIPGIHVGDQFFFRMEMCVVGLHGQVQAGIDYVAGTRRTNGEPIATSIIVSGGYEDDEDSGDMIIYTGHGGKEVGNMRHSVHQKLEGGNLGLERSRHYGIEVRVIRGIKCDGSPTGRVYIYDGLYRVLEYWLDIGKSGFGVYKYKLLRIEGQPDMGTVVRRFAEELKRDPLSVRPSGYLSLDISMGKERLPVYLFNDIDSDQDPMYFDYLVRPVYPFGYREAGMENGDSRGCDCTSVCQDGCYCLEKNGGEFAYDNNGILLRGKPLVYECGRSCHCPESCRNRVSQKGLRHRLEIFRSRETGWGVRSLDMIRAGAFICEYTGVILTKQQASVVAMSGDSLIYPDRFPGRWVEWGDISRPQLQP